MKKLSLFLRYLFLCALLGGTQTQHAGQTQNQKSPYCEAILYKILQAKKPETKLYDKLTNSMLTLVNHCDNDFVQVVQRFEWSAQELRKEIAQQDIKTDSREESIELANRLSPLTTDKLKAILCCAAHANNLILFKKLFHINYHQLDCLLKKTEYAVVYNDFFKLFMHNNEEAITWLYCFEKYLKETNFNLLENELYYDIVCFFDDESSVQCIQNKQYDTIPCIKPALFYSAKKVQKQLLYGFNVHQLRAIELTTNSEYKETKKIELTLTSYIDKEKSKKEDEK